ncbi:MAG: hypothetical protein ACSLFF_09940 [Solirubrobacterales bacterium]
MTNETIDSTFSTITSQCDSSHLTPALGSRICPQQIEPTAQVNLSQFPEGKNRFRVTAFDLAGNLSSESFEVILDRSTPDITFTDLSADFDDEEGSSTVGFTVTSDPVLPDGELGSGIVNFRYRFRHSGVGEIGQAVWSDWTETQVEGFEFGGATPGEIVEVQVQSFDGVGNQSPIFTASANVSAVCLAEGQADDFTGRQLHAGVIPSETAFDSVTLVNPVSQHRLLDALPSTAKVLSVLERTYTTGGGDQSSGMAPTTDRPLQASLDEYNAAILDDLEAQHRQMTRHLATLEGDARVPYVNSIRMLDETRSIYARRGGVPVKSIAFAPNNSVRSALEAEFSGNISADDQESHPTNVSCASDGMTEITDDPNGGSIPTALVKLPLGLTPLIGLVGTGAQPVQSSSDPSWDLPATDVDATNSPARFSPKRVHIYAGYRENAGKFITARWRWTPGTTAYWRDRRRQIYPDRGDNQRGVELQVRMDLDGAGPWGKPAWGEEDPTSRNVDPGLWSKRNMRCAYPDDYNNPDPTQHELQGRYNLTIGEGCRPVASRFVSSWTHWLATDSHSNIQDLIGVEISPMHRAKSDHKADIFGANIDSELGWCNRHSRARGSCRFTDHTSSNTNQSYVYPGSMWTPAAFSAPDTVPTTEDKVFSR